MSDSAGPHSVQLTVTRIDQAVVGLLATASDLSDEQMGAPSLLPGWSRGHVLTHIARNADGLCNLLTWARTGVETPQYASREERDAQIEAGAGRPASEIIDDVTRSANEFASLARELPDDAWLTEVRGMRGPAHPAWFTLHRRLTEVHVHHVDLGAGYTTASWPDWFVTDMLYRVAGDFAAEPSAPHAVVTDASTGRQFLLGADAEAGPLITGPGHELLAWLLGRSDGAGLTREPDGPLPAVPPF